ncbi:MAG: SIMPL domain-containing protein [Bacteroidales bacterium]|nr:SIMPL domain-containing protein [Bacteroidales bacterium]
MSNINKIIISCILGLCFVGGALALGLSFFKAKAPVRTVSVVGMASRDFQSDLIVQTFTYSVLDMDMKSGYEKIKHENEVVKKFLQDNGIDMKDVTFKTVSTNREEEYVYDRATERSHYEFVGYRLTQSVRIESKNISAIEKLNLADLMSEDINVDISNPSYYYTKLADLKIAMLADATKDAQNRANTIVKNAGGKLGGLKTSNMGVFQITAPNSNDEDYEWGGAFNTTSKNKRVSITMRLTYYVK